MGEFCPTYKVKYYDDLLSSGKVGIMEALQKLTQKKEDLLHGVKDILYMNS